jgi:hypothetical protein
MSSNMKIIMENYRAGSMSEGLTLFEIAGLNETELSVFEYLTVNEGIGGLISGMRGFYDQIKKWTSDKITDFLKKMADGYATTLQKLRSKGLINKLRHRTEIRAVKTLLTKKHIDLAIAILGAMFKLAGGYVIDKLVEMPEIFNKFSNILNQIKGGDIEAALMDLFGDLEELKQIIKGAIEYSKDVNSPSLAALMGDYSEFGGLAEQEDANSKIDQAQIETQKIASKLSSELEAVSKNSGLDMATISSLFKQFIDQEIK